MMNSLTNDAISKNHYTQHYENTHEYYYKKAREIYARNEPDFLSVKSFHDLKIETFHVGELHNSIFKLGDQYLSLISQMALIADGLLPYANYTHYDLSKFVNGEELSTIKFLSISRGLKTLMYFSNQDRAEEHGFDSFNLLLDSILSLIMPTIEREIIGSYCRPWFVSMSRSVFSEKKEEWLAQSDTSFQWHSDATPDSCFKLFFYLTDVDENSAPFTYLVDPNGNPVHRPANDWVYIAKNSDDEHKKLNPSRGDSSRISIDEINKLKSEGCKEKKVCMPAGSFMVWNPNYIHRATIPKTRHRDVLQIQLRSVHKKPDSYWFGSNGQTDLYQQFDWWSYD